VSIFEHACRQPFGNQPDDSPVANPMLDESDQPVTADLVEKGLNVAIAEDQGGLATLQEIERRFGASVAEIVSDCTDAWTEPKPDWRARKEAYIAKLPTKPKRSLLVSLADKVHNAEAILFDHRILGNALWARFTGAAEGTRWYYGELAEFFVKAMPGRLSDRLSRAVAEFAPTTAKSAIVRNTPNEAQMALRAFVNKDATQLEVLLELSEDQKAALAKELARLTTQLPMLRAISDAPSFKRRQRIISGVVKHISALRIFASSENDPERFAREDICFAALTFPEEFDGRHREADNFALAWRWFDQTQRIEAITNAALDNPILRVMRAGLHVPPYRQRLIGRILPGLFEKIFQKAVSAGAHWKLHDVRSALS